MCHFHTDDADAVEWEKELRGERELRGKSDGRSDEVVEPDLLADGGD